MSGFLLDTNVPSELVRSRPNPDVNAWFSARHPHLLSVSSVTLGELRKGLVLLPSGERRSRLERWFEGDLVPRFGGRILPLTGDVADRWEGWMANVSCEVFH